MSTALPLARAGAYSETIGRPIDNTALSCFMLCPKKFEYAMLQHRRREGLPSPSLAYGSIWHKALETHYRLGGGKADRERNKKAVTLAVYGAWRGSSKIDDYRTAERCLVEYDKFVDKYGMPAEETAKTVGWPEQPLVEIATEVSIPGARHPYSGKIDRLISLQGLYYVEDHKTTSRWSESYFVQYVNDNQMMGYAKMAWELTGLLIAGVRINCHVVRKNDSQFERQVITFSKDRLQEWVPNYDQWLGRIEHAIQTKDFPRNHSACAGKYGMCDYTGVCSTGPAIRDRVLEQDFDVVPWNPLEAEDADES